MPVAGEGFRMAVEQEVRELQAMRELNDRLVRRFGDSHPRDEVAHTITTVHHEFDGRPIRDFVPVLVERLASEKLRSPVQAT